MKTLEMISCWGYAPEYDSALCNNGGSYYQPTGGALFSIGGQPVSVEIDDSSCGEFGSRVYVSIDTGTHNWSWTTGTMDDAGIAPRAEEDNILASVSGVLGVDAWADLVRPAIAAMDWAAMH